MGINVLSLFDGMSCGQIALERIGIEVDNYYASEIDKYAISVSKKNYPNTVHMGDITKWREWNIDFKSIDLIIGGSPCQGFSFAGKQLALNDPRSKLFFVYADILNHVMGLNSNVKFLLENVKMKKESEDVITMCVSVEPISINSALVSAQNRKRIYWTNIEGVTQPEDKGILLKDIIHETEIVESELTLNVPEATKKGFCEVAVGECVDLTFLNSKTRRGRLMKDKSNCLTATNYEYNLLESLKEYIVPFDKTLQILDKEIEKGKVGFFRKDSQANRVYFIHGKSVTLCGEAGGGAAKMGQYLFGCITPDRVNKRQNGQRFSEGNKFYTLTAQDKHGILIEGYIRKLTPIECERLQTVPDGYTEFGIDVKGDEVIVSNSQRYKMLGNGWTVSVITHIFNNLKI